jgi:MFS family permease
MGEMGGSATVRSLPRSAKWYLIATLVNMIGNGMLFGFLFIYFTDVVHFSSTWTGVLLSVQALTGIAVMSVGGWIVDHIGAKRALQISVLYSALVFGLFTWATTKPIALVVCVLTGIGQGMMTPAQQAFASVVVPKSQRPTMSSWQRIVLNVGAGIGIAAAGFFVKVNRPGTFTLLFFLNVASFVGYVIIISVVHPVAADEHSELVGSYLDVLRDKFFVRLLPLDLATGVMFGMVFLVMPTTYLTRLGASEKTVGLVTVSGTVAVIVTQLGIARFIRGRARLLALGAMFAMFFFAFGFGLLASGQSVLMAALFVSIAQCVGGLGESIMGPTRGPLTADLAPPHLLGRYFGLQSMMFTGGFGLSAGISGALLDVSLRGTWIVGASLAAAAGAWSVRIDRLVPQHARISP